MNKGGLLSKGWLKYVDVAYYLKFILIFLVLHRFHLFYYGITTPGGKFYSSFLANHVNYIKWLGSTILYTANFFTRILGLDTYLQDNILKVEQGASVILAFSCLGLGVKSFWIAFSVAQSSSWQKKLYWCLAGVLAIWFINCWRIAILLVALQEHWQVNKYMDHHDTFNWVAYILILIMMYLYHRESSKQTYTVSPV